MNKTQNPMTLFVLGTIMQSLTMTLAVYYSDQRKIDTDEWLRAKRATIIPCGSGTINNEIIQLSLADKKEPQDKNSGNGCSHQTAPGVMCSFSNTRGRKIVTC